MSETQKTKPEAVALLMTYLEHWSRKGLTTPGGCDVSRNGTSFDIRVNDEHMVSVLFRNPDERSVLLAYRVLCLESAWDRPIYFVRASYNKAKDNLDHLLSRLNDEYFDRPTSDDLITESNEVHEWLYTLSACLYAVHPKRTFAPADEG